MLLPRVFAVVLVATQPIAAGAEPTFADGELAKTLDEHVRAIQTRDIAALERTLTSGGDLELILPNGKRTTAKADYLALHRDWFAATNWTWELEAVSIVATDDLAVVTARTRNEETEGTSTAWAENWLTLTFRREDGAWRLVHDQNTRIRTGPVSDWSG